MIFLSKKEQQKVNEELWEAVRIGDVVKVKILLYGADVNAKGFWVILFYTKQLYLVILKLLNC
jgi:hypothetical protein